jgi:glyoxylase-like metal-dependent hydrolase (beta-lactamase superfamily II)
MRVTKFVHSCLLVEHDGKAVLIDPGTFSWPAIEIGSLPPLDAVLITHLHPDHCYPEALNQLREHFEGLTIVSNPQTVDRLAEEGIEATSDMPAWGQQEVVRHADLTFTPAPQNSAFHLFGRLSHLGDSFDAKKNQSVIAFPITAPWGGLWPNLQRLIALKPEAALPIHDWHWNDQARKSSYEAAAKTLAEHGIKFIPLKDGVPVKIETQRGGSHG